MTRNPCPEPQTWFKYTESALPPEERAGLEAHLSDCPPCRSRLDRADAVLRTAKLDREEDDLPEGIWEQASRRIGDNTPPAWKNRFQQRISPPRRIFTWKWGAAAAAVLLAAMMGLRIGADMRKDGADPSFSKNGVRMSAGESAQWRWKEAGDAVRLESGSAAFDVDPTEKGFRVDTPSGTVEVLGTRFSVRVIPVAGIRENDARTQVAVVDLEEGKVLLSNRTGEQGLSPGERGILVEGFRPGVIGHRRVVSADEKSKPGGDASPENLRATWNEMRGAFRRGDSPRIAYLTAVLAAHGEPAAALIESELESLAGPEREWTQRVLHALRE